MVDNYDPDRLLPLDDDSGMALTWHALAHGDGTERYRNRLKVPTGRRPCRLPLKTIIAGVIDIDEVIRMASSRHRPYVEVVAQVLRGIHPVWANLRRASPPRRPPSSDLDDAHIRDLIRWGVIAPIPRQQRHRLIQTVFLRPKSDGLTARPLYDARFQNTFVRECIDELAPWGPRFRLLSPLNHVRVGLAEGVDNRPTAYEADATSYFPSFRWDDTIATLFALRARGNVYKHVVPVQGLNIMPWVAQVTSASLAGAPPVTAPAEAWVKAGISIVYDNWLITGEEEDVIRRSRIFEARARRAGVHIGTTTGVTRRLTCCGFEFNLEDPAHRRWRLKPAWTEKATKTLEKLHERLDQERPAHDQHQRLHDRQVEAGIAIWVTRARLRPLLDIDEIIRPFARDDIDDDVARDINAQEQCVHKRARLRRQRKKLRAVIAANGWRILLRGPPRMMQWTIIFVDASIEAMGVVTDTYEWTRIWTDAPRPSTMQQRSEAEAATQAISWACRQLRPNGVLLIVDNTGVRDALISGNPAVEETREMLRGAARDLRRSGCVLRTAYIPTERMPADGPSRPSEWLSNEEWKQGAEIGTAKNWNIDEKELNELWKESKECEWTFGGTA